MFDGMVLNEASLPFKSKLDCENKINDFFNLLHLASSHNVKFTRADDVEGYWNQLDYAENFNFGQWLNEIPDKELQRQVKSVLSNVQCPLINKSNNQHVVNGDDMIFTLSANENIEVLGLGFASLNGSHGLSFLSEDYWEKDIIPIIALSMRGRRELSEKVEVPNISTAEHLESFLEKLEASRQENKKYFDGLNVSDNEDFKNLFFSESVLKTLRSPSLHPNDFRKIIEILNKLDKSIVDSNSLESLSINSGLDITGESDSTMKSRSLSGLRKFKHPSPKIGHQFFEDHVKNFSGNKRMHILADYDSNTVCIGYFGKHLKTAKS